MEKRRVKMESGVDVATPGGRDVGEKREKEFGETSEVAERGERKKERKRARLLSSNGSDTMGIENRK